MDKSIFTNEANVPGHDDLAEALAETYPAWQQVMAYMKTALPGYIHEWNFSAKYGWSFRIKDKKRAIVYLLPRDKFFKVAFVFGNKATDLIMKSAIAGPIKDELQAAKVYAEGRGIRIDITGSTLPQDIRSLIDIKLKT